MAQDYKHNLVALFTAFYANAIEIHKSHGITLPPREGRWSPFSAMNAFAGRTMAQALQRAGKWQEQPFTPELVSSLAELLCTPIDIVIRVLRLDGYKVARESNERAKLAKPRAAKVIRTPAPLQLGEMMTDSEGTWRAVYMEAIADSQDKLVRLKRIA